MNEWIWEKSWKETNDKILGINKINIELAHRKG